MPYKVHQASGAYAPHVKKMLNILLCDFSVISA